MSRPRAVIRTGFSRGTLEGAGVRLHRAFGYNDIPDFDPFLMLDDFRADDPADYLAGFPWHPHRGIETVTYMLEGTVEHGDSMGHTGNVDAGCVQWMTSGSGIIHQEMPKPVNGRMGGFQLWVNLPRKDKMTDPRYQEIPAADIPTARMPGGASVKVICGSIGGVSGPVSDLMAEPGYFDVTLEATGQVSLPVRPGHRAAAYVIGGTGAFDKDHGNLVNRTLVRFGDPGDAVDAVAGNDGMRFLFITGRPLGEPVAWGGPIVMNNQEELRQAFVELENNTFIRHRP
ncbi:MAG: pirin family protein [Methanoregula sp.]|jgi:hypothetical protein